MTLLNARLWALPAVLAIFVLMAWLGPGSAAEKAEPQKVEQGKPAPNIDLPATQIAKALPGKTDAKTLSLKDLQNKKNVVLYFFPKALTGG
jgi:hypothetical protein